MNTILLRCGGVHLTRVLCFGHEVVSTFYLVSSDFLLLREWQQWFEVFSCFVSESFLQGRQCFFVSFSSVFRRYFFVDRK